MDASSSVDLAARLDVLSNTEKAELRERAKTFGQYHAYIGDYLGDDAPWYIHRGDLVIDGDFDNDWLLVVDGDLTIRGYYADGLGEGYSLLCLGDLRAQQVLSSGALSVTGSLYSAGLVAAVYNDYPFEVYGSILKARGLILDDKAWRLPDRREVDVKFDSDLGGEEDVFGGIFSPKLFYFESEDSEELSAEQALELYRQGEFISVQANYWDNPEPYRNTPFTQTYQPPSEPLTAGAEDLRLALMQTDAKREVFGVAWAQPELYYDLALAPATPPDMLQSLAQRGTSSSKILWAVASHPATPVEVLAELARHSDERVRAAVIHNPAATSESIAHLIDDDSTLVRRALAASKQAMPYLDHLVRDADPAVRRALASHASLSLGQRRILITDTELAVRARALNYTPSSAELVREFVQSESPELRQWATQHSAKLPKDKALSGDNLQQQLFDPSPEVREAALRSGEISLSFLEQNIDRFARDDSILMRRAAASVTRRADILAELAQDFELDVRQAAAGNLATPSDVLIDVAKRLAEQAPDPGGMGMTERESFASFHLMGNPLLPAEAFRHITRFYPHSYNLEPHGNMPLELFLDYANDGNSFFLDDDLEKAATLVDDPPECLRYMAYSENSNLQTMAALNPQTPADVLVQMAKRWEQDNYLMQDLARNAYLGRSTPQAKQLRTLLLKHKNHEVVSALLSNPHLPKEILQREAERDYENVRRVLWARYGIELAVKPA